jgi:hypothetical protein
MALPSRLSKRLREVLGVEAADDMVTFMEELRSQRTEVLAAIQKLDDKLTETRVHLADRIANVKVDVANVKADVANVTADLMKWSFLFWVGAVAAIAMLANVLGR